MLNKGERVVCIDDSGSEGKLKKGEFYVVQGNLKCCENDWVDVGLSTSHNSMGHCIRCNKIVPYSNHVFWVWSNRFARVEEIPESHEIAVKELIETLTLQPT